MASSSAINSDARSRETLTSPSNSTLCQAMQFVVNQRRQLVERFFVTASPLPQQFSYFMLRSCHDFTWVSG